MLINSILPKLQISVLYEKLYYMGEGSRENSKFLKQSLRFPRFTPLIAILTILTTQIYADEFYTGTITTDTTITGTHNKVENSGTFNAGLTIGDDANINDFINTNIGSINRGITHKGIITTITNNGTISSGADGIEVGNVRAIGEATINNLINNGTINGISIGATNTNSKTIGQITTLANYGTISKITNKNILTTLNNYGIINSGTSGNNSGIRNSGTIGTINNYGLITTSSSSNDGAINVVDKSTIDTINNYGTIENIVVYGTINNLNNQGKIFAKSRDNKYTHIQTINSNAKINISNYHLIVNKNANDFNSFTSYTTASDDTSHLVISESDVSNSVRLLGADSKFLLTLGDSFELGKDYDLNKLVTDTSGNKYTLTYANGGSV
ncbi:hypothetical protein CCY99_08640, partial [Helicobacter sp. 16-1353]|uniref:hypothetical protein n=1 Tax=Helicobacter sp. 16-1353 TaxID=2004996 RepID=UPI000DCE43D1